MAEKKLFLLDALALIYRAYFALIRNPLHNSKGLNVSAIQGFTNTLYDLINRENPSHMAVVFDLGEPTERTEIYEDYKATREETPDDIVLSLDPIREITEASGIPWLELEGYEADDIIGTLAKKAERKGYTTYMVTPDKDFGQLVSENVLIYKPISGGGGFDVLGVQEILAKWNITDVKQVIDILGLMGDSVDNIPGVPGVGEKTAVKLLAEFGSIENLLKNTHKVKGKLREKIEANSEDALLSKQLATINLSVPIAFNEKQLKRDELDRDRLAALFEELEFRTTAKRILGEEPKPKEKQHDLFSYNEGQAKSIVALSSIDQQPHAYTVIEGHGPRAELVEKLRQAKRLSIEVITDHVDPMQADILGIAFSTESRKAGFIPVEDSAQEVLKDVKPLFESDAEKVSNELKKTMLVLRRHELELQGDTFDNVIAHFLLEPEVSQDIGIVSESYLGYKPIDVYGMIGKKYVEQGEYDKLGEALPDFSCERADIGLQLRERLEPLLAENQASRLFQDIEMPLLSVLTDMQFEGVNMDTDFLKGYSKELTAEIDAVQESIQSEAAEEFNIDSPKQLGDILFGKLKIPYEGRKTKTGQFSTSEEILAPLASEHEVVENILTYRHLSKLKSTYVDALPQLVNPATGRVHSTLSQTVAVTGRLSSNNPNLQNIPIRTERGREIRKAFIARDEDHVLLSADYSQVELRIIASLSEDKNLMDAFTDGHDIHASTASKVYGVDLDTVTPEMRRSAKMVNFGIIYGISAFGLAQRLGIPRGEAKDLIDNYFEQYPKVKEYMDKSIQFARDNGYVQTMLGRRRHLKDIQARNYTVRSFAERNAINSPIQGTAADMIKIAMVNIHREMTKRKLKSKMILQVHDELLFDMVKTESEELQELVLDKMKTALELKVPVGVEAGTGSNWLEAH